MDRLPLPERRYNNHSNLFVKLGITPEELIDTYMKEGSTYRVAEKLGVSRKSVEENLRRYKVKMFRHRQKEAPSHRIHKYPNAVARWLEANPGRRLPNNIKEAAALVGLSEKSFRRWLSTKKKRAIDYVTSFPPLQEYDFRWTSTDGRVVRTIFFSTYHYRVDTFCRRFIVHATVKSTKFEFSFKIDELVEMILNHPYTQKSKAGVPAQAGLEERAFLPASPTTHQELQPSP